MNILVEIGYMDFIFSDIDEAVNFARTAHKSLKSNDGRISITITFCEEGEADG